MVHRCDDLSIHSIQRLLIAKENLVLISFMSISINSKIAPFVCKLLQIIPFTDRCVHKILFKGVLEQLESWIYCSVSALLVQYQFFFALFINFGDDKSLFAHLFLVRVVPTV